MDIFIYHNVSYIYVIRWSFSGRLYIIMYFFLKISILVGFLITFIFNKKYTSDFIFFKKNFFNFESKIKLTEYLSLKYKSNSTLENVIFFYKYDGMFFCSGILINFFIPIFFIFISDEYWFLDYNVFLEDWFMQPRMKYAHAYDFFYIKDNMYPNLR